MQRLGLRCWRSVVSVKPIFAELTMDALFSLAISCFETKSELTRASACRLAKKYKKQSAIGLASTCNVMVAWSFVTDSSESEQKSDEFSTKSFPGFRMFFLVSRKNKMWLFHRYTFHLIFKVEQRNNDRKEAVAVPPMHSRQLRDPEK